jgi:DNA transformation protein
MAKAKAVRDNTYVEFVTEQLAPLGEITSRAMMGGHVLYCDGAVFALIAKNVLYLKADDENRPQFQAAGLKAFRPFEDRDAAMHYYEAPPEIFENSDALRDWVGGAVRAGIRAAAKKKKRSAKNVKRSL